ncbi:MAG: redoxin domain-containing protein [Pseudomonadota bacterium]
MRLHKGWVSVALVGLFLLGLPQLVNWWWEPKWDSTPKAQDGLVVFDAYQTIHPSHYSLGQTFSILSKVDIEYTLFMVLKDLSRFFSDEEATYEVGNDRLDEYYRNFEGNFQSVARIGTQAFDFELTTTEGKTVRLSDYRGKPVAFMFVAITCPPAVMQRDAWRLLHEKYADMAELLLVYSIEQHPGEAGYPEFVHPKTFEEKFGYAQQFAESTPITVAVDTFEKTVLRNYDPLPNPAYVIDEDGYIVFKSSWADVEKVDRVLASLTQ